jgi:hypothetical protein
MKWFRSNIRSGARLALFALFVQFALSFGHFHALAAPAAPSALPSIAQTQVDAGDLAVESLIKPQQSPVKQDGDQQLPDACAVCAVMAMASTVLSASPPILLLPEAIELLYRSTDAEFVHLKSAGSSFQPRAPPAS